MNTIKCRDKNGKQVNIMFHRFSFDETDNHQSETYKSLIKMANDYNILVSMLGNIGKILYYLPISFKRKLFINDLKNKSEFEGYIVYDIDNNNAIGMIDLFKSVDDEYNLGIILLQEYQNRGLALPILSWLVDNNKNKKLVIKTLVSNQRMIKVAEKLNFVLHSVIDAKILFKTEKLYLYKINFN